MKGTTMTEPKTKREPTNYVKLCVRHDAPLDDDESIPRPPVDLAGERRRDTVEGGYDSAKFVTTWIWSFNDASKLEAVEALGLAQSKRSKLREKYPTVAGAAFQLSTFRASCLRGVREIGESVRVPLQAAEGVA
jgi:hypothetical protein